MAINIKLLSQPKLTFWEKLYLPQIIKGLWITLKHIINHKPITVKYPEQIKQLPENYLY